MIHRHLDYPADTPLEERSAVALDDVLDRGDLEEWAPLAELVAGRPWGATANRLLDLCDAHPMYGTSSLWRAFIFSCRVPGGAIRTAGRPAPLPRRRPAEIRAEAGLTQAAVGGRLRMTQSEVSRLERRSDLRISTLRAFLAAAGADLLLLADRRPGSGRGPSRVVVQVGPPARVRSVEAAADVVDAPAAAGTCRP